MGRSSTPGGYGAAIYDPSMADLTLWHNQRCSKSRGAHEILEEAGVAFDEKRYLDDPPTAAELDSVLTALGMEPWELARMGEDVAKELSLKDLEHDRQRWIEVMVANPILIERPILVTKDGRAVVGRPPEAVRALL
jgi:arsenate reductase